MTKKKLMKIFSLQSKTSLVIWSIFFGVMAQILSIFVSWQVGIWEISQCNCLVTGTTNVGWPFSFTSDSMFGNKAFWLGIIFWMLIVYIILFITRKLKYRKASINLSSATK
jgi:hypothetical protein